MAKKNRILVINGPNLNLLGTREPEIYGSLTLSDIERQLQLQAEQLGVTLSFMQSNREHELIEAVQDARKTIDFIVINPAAYTHTSIALRDALSAVAIPFIEVHLSNVHSREAFRRHSYFSDLAQAVICGCGAQGYEFALAAAANYLNQNN